VALRIVEAALGRHSLIECFDGVSKGPGFGSMIKNKSLTPFMQ
jgi:hypothetical protein